MEKGGPKGEKATKNGRRPGLYFSTVFMSWIMPPSAPALGWWERSCLLENKIQAAAATPSRGETFTSRWA